MNAFRKAFGHKLTNLHNEGITLKYHPPKSPGMEGGYSWHHVTAHDPTGKQIGHVEFSEGVGSNESMPHGTEVDPAHKRKGIASAMYNHYEKMTGHKILPDDVQSDDAKALWAQKKSTIRQVRTDQVAVWSERNGSLFARRQRSP